MKTLRSVVAVIVLASAGLVSATMPAAHATPTGAQARIDVFLLTFSDAPASGLTKPAVETLMNGPTDSVRQYFNEASYGQFTPTAVVHDWQMMPKKLSDYCGWYNPGFGWFQCANNYDVDGQNIARASIGSLVDDPAERVAYVFEGFGTVGIAHGNSIELSADLQVRDIVHELGHTYGLHHSGAACLTGLDDMLHNRCTPPRYAGYYDPMGVNSRQFNAWNKQALGWLDSSRERVATAASSTFEISPVETATGPIKWVRIPVPGTDAFFFVEHREKIGYDAKPPAFDGDATPFDGLLVWLKLPVGDAPMLRQAKLENVGDSYTEPTTGFKVTYTARTSAGGVARIDRVPYPASGDAQVSLVSPVNGATYSDGTLHYEIAIAPGSVIQRVAYYFDNNLKCTVEQAPYSCDVTIPKKTDTNVKATAIITETYASYPPRTLTVENRVNTVKPR